MHRNDAGDDLIDGFEPQPLSIAPDGGLMAPGPAREAPPPPRLCEQGPCANYHRFTTQFDAEVAKGGAIEQGGEHHGRVVGSGGKAPFYVRVHHYCYPAVGVETDLRDLPVLECNRWDPDVAVPGGEYPTRAGRVTAFLASEDGQRYTRELADWKASLEPEVPTAPELDHVIVVFTNHVEHKIKITSAVSMRGMREAAILCEFPLMDNRRDFHALCDEFTVHDTDGNPITNLDASLADLGVANGERFVLTRATGTGG